MLLDCEKVLYAQKAKELPEPTEEQDDLQLNKIYIYNFFCFFV